MFSNEEKWHSPGTGVHCHFGKVGYCSLQISSAFTCFSHFSLWTYWLILPLVCSTSSLLFQVHTLNVFHTTKRMYLLKNGTNAENDMCIKHVLRLRLFSCLYIWLCFTLYQNRDTMWLGMCTFYFFTIRYNTGTDKMIPIRYNKIQYQTIKKFTFFLLAFWYTQHTV